MVSTNSDYWWFFFETCPPYTPHELELLDCGVRRRVLSDFWILLKKFIFPELFVWKIFLMEKVRGKWFFWTVFFVCHFYNVNCYWKNHFHIFVAGKMNCFPNINFAKFVAGKMNYSLFQKKFRFPVLGVPRISAVDLRDCRFRLSWPST